MKILLIGDITKNFAQYQFDDSEPLTLTSKNTVRYIGGVKEIADFICDCHQRSAVEQPAFLNPSILEEVLVKHPNVLSQDYSHLPFAYWKLKRTSCFRSDSEAWRAYHDKNTNLDKVFYVKLLKKQTTAFLIKELENKGHFQKRHVLKAGYPEGTFRTRIGCWPACLNGAVAG